VIFSVRSKRVIKAPKDFSNNYILTITAINLLWYFYLFITPSESLIKALSNIANFIVTTGLYESTSPIYLKSNATNLINWTDYIIGISVKFLMALGTAYYVFNFRKLRINLSYTTMLVASLFIIVAAGTIPAIGKTLVISRYLLHSAIFLAPMTIVGFRFLYDLMFHHLLQVTKNRTVNLVKGISLKNVLTITIAILYFLVGTNAWSVALGGNADPFLFKNEGENYERFYIHPEEVEALTWLSSRNPDAVYCDRYGVIRSVSYGNFIDAERYEHETGKTYVGSRKVYALRYELLNETSYLESLKDKIIFLRYENVVMKQFKFLYKDEVITIKLDQIPSFNFLLSQKAKIYDDVTVEIYL